MEPNGTMLKQPGDKRTQNPRVKYPHICADAKALGLCRTTLWRYLSGSWPWPKSTLARYEVLQSTRAAALKGQS